MAQFFHTKEMCNFNKMRTFIFGLWEESFDLVETAVADLTVSFFNIN